MRQLGSLALGFGLVFGACGGDGFTDQAPGSQDASTGGSGASAGSAGADAGGAGGDAGGAGGDAAAQCPSGKADCDKNPANGCEVTPASDPSNCGACGKECATPAHAQAACDNATCVFTCDAKFEDCDGEPGNGCEADLDNAPGTCGSCAKACTAEANATATCKAGACGWECKPGFGDCSAGAGCETDTNTNVQHCGGCNKVCSTAHGQAACNNGSCSMVCDTGYGDCDAVNSNGCEADVLTDVKNCGWCGHDCGTSACANGVCAPTLLGTSTAHVTSMTQFGESLYFTGTSPLTPVVMRQPKIVGSAVPLVPSAQAANAIAVDAGGVYWIVPGTGEIKWVALAGGPVQVRVSGLIGPRILAMDANDLFFFSDPFGKLGKAPKTGGSPTQITTPSGASIGGVALDDSTVYWTVTASNLVEKVAKTGGAPALVADNQGTPDYIVVDAQYVFWTAGGKVLRRLKSGGAIDELATVQLFPMWLQADAEWLYWINDATSVVKISKQGGQVVPLALAGNHAQHLQVDDKYVYWVNNLDTGDVSFYRVPK